MRLNNNNEKLAYKQIVGLPKIEQKKHLPFDAESSSLPKKPTNYSNLLLNTCNLETELQPVY